MKMLPLNLTWILLFVLRGYVFTWEEYANFLQ